MPALPELNCAPDPTKWMQHQQILIPADKMGSLATEGEFEKFIVLRVTTVSHYISDHH